MPRVVVFSPSRYSLYTITVTELLHQEVDVAAVVVRQLVNPGRFTSEFRRDGTRLLRKIVRKLFLREHAYGRQDYEILPDMMRIEGIQSRSVDDLRSQKGIPVISVKDLNDSAAVALLEEMEPDLVVFTGGGILRPPVLERAGAGVVNCHAGILPAYRGMDVIEWAILEGRLDMVGITVHFMDQGVDTGDILRAKHVKLPSGIRIGQIRDLFEPVMCREIVSTSVDFMAGRLTRKPQRKEDGKQYFIMHPRLLEETKGRLKVLNADYADK